MAQESNSMPHKYIPLKPMHLKSATVILNIQMWKHDTINLWRGIMGTGNLQLFESMVSSTTKTKNEMQYSLKLGGHPHNMHYDN
jgi:hypothetical protein